MRYTFLWDTNRSPNLGYTTRPSDFQHKENITCWIVNFDFVVDYKVKLKENKKRYEHLDVAREPKVLWSMKLTLIPTVNSALVSDNKGLLREHEDLKISGRVETIQTTTLSRSERILRRVPET